MSLDESTYMQVLYSGRWTAETMRDLHALFATWYVADPERLTSIGAPLTGVLQEAKMELERSSGPRA